MTPLGRGYLGSRILPCPKHPFHGSPSSSGFPMAVKSGRRLFLRPKRMGRIPREGLGSKGAWGRGLVTLAFTRRGGATEAGEQAEMPERIAAQFRAVQHPALNNKTYTRAVNDFAESAILAYECGYTEEGLARAIGGLGVGLVGGGVDGEVQGCMEFLAIVWITLMLSHRSVVRWGTGKAVSDESLGAWKGFVSMIVSAYFDKRWAWYPIDRLQMEMEVMTGRSERPALVAERARIVYATLERVAPQFPSV
ncbi:unnamed protein product [Ostreobium quekettii]|uniref:DUF7876 domain-containing protein n=1 Tax=Ostreobium quekettii TaxID=121088 RepID=A0A8S1IXW8_9CHLO|nr:unnamed protein product [Ostreobium quekettii]|eukprot:evm.model.scf_979.4 EVM.evm.TU.scf_979.4   scf_979:26539-27291(+)